MMSVIESLFDFIKPKLTFWLILGLVAQFLFFMRFFIQWVVSERRGQSVIPIGFWYLSLAGGGLLFIYAVHLGDPIFILGQSMGFIIYSRNLYLIYKNKKKIPVKSS